MPINKNDLPQQARTNAQKVRQQNQQAAQSAGGYQSYNAANQTEFASETSAQEVNKQNQQSMAKKNRNQANQ
ncbi:gamma-type small acid-soluble spore protein [Hazenella coriacea]|uniref:Small, acid-soluble spore protein gamma-type n=1 Tax=Hazenella coriacea TaxID=1179467 RepID=A0A4R3L7C7_9BACL|nr:gamma-type small acid-soluble spore protein [Hazenella coriacea]TCS94935.1 gamma type small acid-soluble spore protein [Hazenella coriacea]